MGRDMRKIIHKVEGIALTTNEFVVRGRKWKFSEEELKKYAPTMIGKPITVGHRGSRIGIMDDAWYEDGKVKFRASLYEPRNDEEKEAIEQIITGKKSGISTGFTYPIVRPKPKGGVFHGKIEVLGKTEDGHLKVKFIIPKEEIEKKIGSVENLDKISIDRFWLHDGSDETKKNIEDKYKKSIKSRTKA